MHFDSDEAVDGRRLSAIFYLNPGWKPEHGGQLRLLPFGEPMLRRTLPPASHGLKRAVPCAHDMQAFFKEIPLYNVSSGAPPVDIAPLHDRLVIFASTMMLHRWLCFFFKSGCSDAASSGTVASAPASASHAG